MALEHLSGNRFSAFREVDGKYIGTGAYVIEEIGPELLKLTPNSYFPHPAKRVVELSVVPAKDSLKALLENKIDVMAYAMGGAVSEHLLESKEISTVVGQDAIHRAIYPNAQKGHLFEKKEFRQALQYLITKYLEQNPGALGNPQFTSVDAQVYLPFQAGRLEQADVRHAIAQGEQYVPSLLAAAAINPPVVIETEEFSLKPILKAVGLPISAQSRVVSKGDLIAIIYSGKEADLIPGSFGVASGDPDGMYHLLGKNGAITSPMLTNHRVGDLLEQGRSIIRREEVDPFYQSASRAILDEAPIVHMGFNKAVSLYRNDKVEVSKTILRRNEGHLYIFEAKE